MKNNKRLLIGITMMLLLTAVTACGKAKKEDIASDLNNIGVDTNTDTGTVDIPGHLDYVVQTLISGRTITVSAEVDTSGLANADVYEVNHIEVDEKYLKQLADGFFEGDYTYIKPYEHCSLEELEQEEAFYQQLTDEYGTNVNSFVSAYREKLDTLIKEYAENATSYMVHDGLIYHNEQWSMEEDCFYDDIVEDLEFRITSADYSRLRGEIDGHVYELYYEKYYLQSKTTTSYAQYDPERIIIQRIDTPYYVKRCTDMDANSQSNVCDYNTAFNQAKDTVEKLGFKELVLMETRQLDIASVQDSTYLGLNGYEFWFSLEMNEKNVFNCHGQHMLAYGSEHDSEWVYGTGQPHVRVLVTDEGVGEITIEDVYEKSDSEGQKVELMSFEKIDEIAQQYMSECTPFNDVNITSVKLGYLYISYDGLKYSLIPVWAYGVEDDGREKVFMYINALDGQRIVPANEKHVLGYHPVVGNLMLQVEYEFRDDF